MQAASTVVVSLSQALILVPIVVYVMIVPTGLPTLRGRSALIRTVVMDLSPMLTRVAVLPLLVFLTVVKQVPVLDPLVIMAVLEEEVLPVS